MNTKEIDFLEKLKDCDKTFSNRGCKKRLCKIQKLLKRGEKYEAIVEDIEKDFNDLHCNFFSEHAFNLVKQKYFPNPKKKVIK